MKKKTDVLLDALDDTLNRHGVTPIYHVDGDTITINKPGDMAYEWVTKQMITDIRMTLSACGLSTQCMGRNLFGIEIYLPFPDDEWDIPETLTNQLTLIQA